jgi:hypothetical protein
MRRPIDPKFEYVNQRIKYIREMFAIVNSDVGGWAVELHNSRFCRVHLDSLDHCG